MIINAHAHCDVRFECVHTPEVLTRMVNHGTNLACILEKAGMR